MIVKKNRNFFRTNMKSRYVLCKRYLTVYVVTIYCVSKMSDLTMPWDNSHSACNSSITVLECVKPFIDIRHKVLISPRLMQT